MLAPRPRRSALYMPGSSLRSLEKAQTLAADTLILDLEDAVAPDAKPDSREIVRAVLAGGGFAPREVLVRINALSTPWGLDDLEMAVAARPDGIVLPKVSTVAQLDDFHAELARLGAPDTIALWAMIETPLAILNVREIAAGVLRPGSRLAGFVIGTNDLARETGARIVPGRAPMIPWLMMALAAARVHGLAILDGVYNDLEDAAGFAAECTEGRQCGFDGKTIIHPRQIEAANRAFAPQPDELAWARKIIAAFAVPDNAALNAIKVDGRMVERLHLEMAERLLAVHRAIALRAGTPRA